MENPDDGTERHHVEIPDDAPQKRSKRKQKKEAKESSATKHGGIEVLTSGEALRRMQNNVFECENSMYCQ
jgi:hypothetical protein